MTRTILTVDDSPSMRQMVATTLRRGGYTVVEAIDGVDALAHAGRHQDVCLVVTDQNMPRMDGFGVIEAIRAGVRNRRVPILVLTTESGAEMKRRARDKGATGWIVKPFEAGALVAAEAGAVVGGEGDAPADERLTVAAAPSISDAFRDALADAGF